jgi:hypothetical protein
MTVKKSVIAPYAYFLRNASYYPWYIIMAARGLEECLAAAGYLGG